MTLQIDDTLYFSSIIFNRYQDKFWENLYTNVSDDSKFFIDLARRINPSRFVTRHGKWNLPWKQEVPEKYRMPTYDPTFSMSFAEVTDQRALEIKESIVSRDERFAVMYSGGIDSAVIVCSLLKNLSGDELKNVTICMSSHAVIENPNFYLKFIKGKFQIIDSNITKYDDLIDLGFRPITADEGDCIFGTVLGLSLYNNYDYLISNLSQKDKLASLKNKFTDPEVHYSEYKDAIIKHFDVPSNPSFGKQFYDKFQKNIDTSTIPIKSLHDYFWWMIFNIKYLNCSVRGAIYFNDRVHCSVALEKIINWYNGDLYQKWSMNNNNNGEKIDKSMGSYKMAARKYIYSIDRNPWYFNFKIKLESLGGSVVAAQKLDHLTIDSRPNARFGLDKDYNVLYIDDPDVQKFIITNMIAYEDRE